MKFNPTVMNEFKEVDKCPVCSNIGFKVAFRRHGYVGKRCSACDVVFVSPVPLSVDGVYKDDITSSPSGYYLLSEEHDSETFTKRLELIEKMKSKGTLLDAGCSVGTMLKTAQERGWSALGLEPNPFSAEICRKRNLNVVEGFIDENLLIKYSDHFDVVHMGDVLEHVPEPIKTVGIALKCLTGGGVLAIVTPNFDSLIARLFQIKPVEHLLYYNIYSLKRLLSQFHVEILLVRKTTRKRKLKALICSTTFTGRPVLKSFLKVFSNPVSGFLLNLLVGIFVRDEITVVARKL